MAESYSVEETICSGSSCRDDPSIETRIPYFESKSWIVLYAAIVVGEVLEILKPLEIGLRGTRLTLSSANLHSVKRHKVVGETPSSRDSPRTPWKKLCG